jgi:citrate lyase subunit beta/citryl-CoA lyase
MTLDRSMLFVPGTRRDMMEKAARSSADAVCLDLEDAVAPAQKAEARREVVRALRTLEFGGRTRVVRVNAVETPWTWEDLAEVVRGAEGHLDAVMLPKAGSARDVQFMDTLLDQLDRGLGLERPVALMVQIETAAGFLHVKEIAGASGRLSTLVFGSGDYAASMRMPLVNIGMTDEFDAAVPGHRFHAVMHAIVAAARAHGLACWDGPYANYTDAVGLGAACRLARAMGFNGKQCIHPAQLPVVNEAFSPTAAEVERARQVVAAYDATVTAGQGAVGVGGTMIDAANLRMARTILAAHDAILGRSQP